MKTKIHLLLLLFASFFVFQANAQLIDVETVQELIDFNVIDQDVILNSNLAYVKQAGESNKAQTIQTQQGEISNFFMMNQDGIGNTGYIKQEGAAHLTQIWQLGNNNEANSWAEGHASSTTIKQEGNNNTINSFIDNEGFVPKVVMLQQQGNGNSIDLALLGNGFWRESFPKVADITQTGNNHGITAKLESYGSPILIKQQPGSSGEGMQINISNSAFNFPTK